MIQQLQASLAREREKATSVEKELRAEIEKVFFETCLWLDLNMVDFQVGSLNREQQAVMQTNMNKAPASQTEAYMQHELTR